MRLCQLWWSNVIAVALPTSRCGACCGACIYPFSLPSPLFSLSLWVNKPHLQLVHTTGILTVGFFGAGLSYLALPVPMLRAVFGGSVGGAGPESIILWQLIGIGLSTIVAPACLSLKVGWLVAREGDTRPGRLLSGCGSDLRQAANLHTTRSRYTLKALTDKTKAVHC